MFSRLGNVYFFIWVIIYSSFSYSVISQDSTKSEIKVRTYTSKEANSQCFSCHANPVVVFKDSASGKIIRQKMYRVIDSVSYYNSNHYDFKCTDCHSSEYHLYPHKLGLRFESKPGCLDCHGGDEQYAKFHFEEIDTAFQKSVHFGSHKDDFTCWSCHDPHSYKLHARNDTNISTTIVSDNMMCLKCHGNFQNFILYSDKELYNIVNKHGWLPNQSLHFRKVRCIECHAQINDSLLVAHQIQPKDKAVKKCVECHSSNSLLVHTLYKHQIKEKINSQGFLNGVILNESYVIGANRNYFLNVFSLIIFLLTITGISVHAFLRYKSRKE